MGVADHPSVIEAYWHEHARCAEPAACLDTKANQRKGPNLNKKIISPKRPHKTAKPLEKAVK